MSMLYKVAVAFAAIFLLSIVSRIVGLVQNYVAARRIGLPIIIQLESWQDPFWILLRPYYKSWTGKLGLWDKTKPDFTTFGFPNKDHFATHAKLGPAFTLVTPFKNNVLVADGEAARTIFKDWRVWIKNPELYGMMESFGRNVNTVNGDEWQRHRKVTAVAFKEANSKLVWKSSLKQGIPFGARMAADSKTSKEGVTLGQLREHTATIAMHVLASAAMGREYDFSQGVEKPEPGQEISYSKAMKTIIHNLSPMLVPLIFAATNLPSALVPKWLRQLQVSVKYMKGNMTEAVEAERQDYHAGGAAKDNLLSSLVRANEVEKQGGAKFSLDNEELYGNLFMFNQAGHETTSSALSYAIPYLVAYPEVQEWIREEVDAVMSEVSEEAYAEAFPRLVRCDALIYETLRFFGAVPFHPKYTGETSQVLRIKGKEYVIPPRTYVSINYYGLHFDPATWGPDVEQFRPSRFVKTSPQGAGHETFVGAPEGATFVAWSFGPRVCPGKKFSQVEFVAVMAALLHKYEIRAAARPGESAADARKRLLDTMFDVEHFISLELEHPENAGILVTERKR